MTGPAGALARHLAASLDGADGPASGSTVLVAVSGGLDSCALLHLLRFRHARRFELVAAHFDHGMRAESAGDAEWLRGLCRAWSVPLRCDRADDPPASEAAARTARYAFLRRAAEEVGARTIMTAHHADDQAETVLFRVLRGTGPAGLGGIPMDRDGLFFRPLLEAWREEVEAYAHANGLSWREDPSNAEVGFARNVLRHEILPAAERLVAPGARHALVRLAEISAADEEAWRELLAPIIAGLDLVERDDGVEWDRSAFGDLHPAVRARVLRGLVERWSLTPDLAGTRAAVEFTSAGRSGSAIELGGGVRLRRELDRLVLSTESTPEPERTLTIQEVGSGSGEVWLGGERVRVSWCASGAPEGSPAETLDVAVDRLPILVRGRRPGDRVRLPGGTRKLKKVLLDARIPLERRQSVAVMVDARGEVLWVPGVVRAEVPKAAESGRTLTIGVS